MKKTLLLASLLFAGHYAASAQQNISFETSEGYTTGTLDGQNGWTVEDDENGENGAGYVVISSSQHSDGTKSLKFVADQEDNALLYDAYKLITLTTTTFNITQDIFVDGIDEDNGSELAFLTNDVQGADVIPTSIVYFDYEGSKIYVMSEYDAEEDNPTFTQVGTFADQTWYHVETKFNLTAGTIEYVINGESVYTATLVGGQEVDAISYAFADYTTSFYADNIVITNGIAGVSKAVAASFSVFPNPAVNTVTIANSNNALINAVTVTDINGRTVKTINYTGVTETQVNVAELSAGIYMMNITSDKGTVTKKIVKQ